MAGLLGIIETARKAIHSSRTGMEVTSHNVSNANTPGYTRQRVELANEDVLSSKDGLINAGVRVSGIKQIRDEFIENEIRRINNSLGTFSVEKEIMSRIEALLNEPSDVGLGQYLENFFNAFDDLAKNPEDKALRMTLLQTANALSRRFNDIFQGLLGIKKDLISQIESRVKNLNEILSEISKLNKKAIDLYNSGKETNDIKDMIREKVKQLSRLVDVNAVFDESGAVRISIGGIMAVDKENFASFNLKFENGQVKILTGKNLLEAKLNSGEIFSLQDSFNRGLSEIMERFDTLARNLINSVNKFHMSGYGLNGKTGVEFFTGTGAGSIQVSKEIRDDINSISASINGDVGNNEIALAIAGLKNKREIVEFYNSIVADIGLRTKTSTDGENFNTMILNQLEAQRDAISGVSIDEEMLNMIKFQKMFEASAKLVQTVNEMIDAVLSMVR